MAESEEISRTVLIAMDGSDCAINAFQWYVQHVHKDNDNIVMVNSIEPHEFLNTPVWFNAPSQLDGAILHKLIEQEKEKTKHKLEAYAEMMKEAKVSGTVRSMHAEKPGEGIIAAAKEANADLIITGCRGHGTIRRTFLGSVSDYIIHHSDVPVLVHRQ